MTVQVSILMSVHLYQVLPVGEGANDVDVLSTVVPGDAHLHRPLFEQRFQV